MMSSLLLIICIVDRFLHSLLPVTVKGSIETRLDVCVHLNLWYYYFLDVTLSVGFY